MRAMGAPIRVVVTGAAGRMGSAVVRAVLSAEGMALAGCTERAGSPALGQDPGPLARGTPTGVRIEDALEKALGAADVVVDFTSPGATRDHADACAAKGVALVVGTTGLGEADRRSLEGAAKRIPVVVSPNMSVGVNVMFKAAADLARALGEDYEIDILEAHHRMKKDAPSGTAMRLAEVLAAARGGKAPLRHARQGMIGERPREEIGLAVLRGGDVVGEHTVFFFGEGERLELVHRATSRDQFARGAIRAARWVCGQPPGLYDMQDVLGLGGTR